MATLKGTAFIWGVDGVTFTGVAISPSTGQVQTIDVSRDSDVASITDENGDDTARVYHNLKKSISVSVVPSGATSTAAWTNANTFMPAPGTAITAVNALGSVIGGAYIVDSSKISMGNRQGAVIDIEMSNGEVNDMSATVT